MGPEVKHASRQYEHVVPVAQRSEQEKKGGDSCTDSRDEGSVVSLCRDALFLIEAGLRALLV